jgi:hypothetical protein
MTKEQIQEIYNILKNTKLNRVVLPKNDNFILGYKQTTGIRLGQFVVLICNYYVDNDKIPSYLETKISKGGKTIGKHNITQSDSTVYKIGRAVLNKLAEQNKQNNK